MDREEINEKNKSIYWGIVYVFVFIIMLIGATVGVIFFNDWLIFIVLGVFCTGVIFCLISNIFVEWIYNKVTKSKEENNE